MPSAISFRARLDDNSLYDMAYQHDARAAPRAAMTRNVVPTFILFLILFSIKINYFRISACRRHILRDDDKRLGDNAAIILS